MQRSFVISLLLGLGFELASPVVRAVEAQPVESITAAALRGHIYFLASDALGGRSANSRGLEVAAQYAGSQFHAAGVLPLLEKGTHGPFSQDVPVVRRTVSGPLSLVVRTAAGEQFFPEGQDVKWFQGEIYPMERRALPLVYVGYGISEPGHGWDDLRGLDVHNKVVLLLMGAPMRNGKPVLPEAVHARYAPPSAVFRKMMTLIGHRAAGIIVLPSPDLVAEWEGLRSRTLGPSDEYDDSAPEVLHIASLFVSKPAFASAIFAGQKRVPPGMAKGARQTTQGFPLANVSVNVVGSFKDEPIPAWNVVGVVRGTDPALKDEYVVVGAHLDSSTPKQAGEIYNGADDDASSQADRAHYALDSEKITPEFTRLIKSVNDRTLRWPLKYENVTGNSDNLSFHFVGIPAVSFYSGHHDDVNTPTDDAEKLDYDKAEKIARLAYEVTMELGDGALSWR